MPEAPERGPVGIPPVKRIVAYPNPTTRQARIKFIHWGVRYPSPVNPRGDDYDANDIPLAQVLIVDVRGRVIRDFGRWPTNQDLQWNGADDAGRPAPAGIYFARATHRGRSFTCRIVLLSNR